METILDLVSILQPWSVFLLTVDTLLIFFYLLFIGYRLLKKQTDAATKEKKEEEKSGFYIRLEREFSNCLGLLHVFGEFQYNSDLMKELHKQKDKVIAFYMENFSEDLKEIPFLPLIPKNAHSISHLLGLLYKNGFLHGRLDYTINELRLVESEEIPEDYCWAYDLHFIEVTKGQNPSELLKKNNLVGVTANGLFMAGLTNDRWQEVDLACTGTLFKGADGTKVPLILHSARKDEMPILSPYTDSYNSTRKIFVIGASYVEKSANKKK